MVSLFSRSELPSRKKFASPSDNIFQSRIARWYRLRLRTSPFASFGLPFILVMVAGSFFLTPATAVRYERFDRKTHMLDKEEALGLGKVRDEARIKGNWKDRDIREEYWVSRADAHYLFETAATCNCLILTGE